MLTSWIHLIEAGNNLNGTLPGELRMFSKLDTISFIEDGLRGTLPSELGDMTSLTTFQLSGQQLSGTIPESFSRLHFRIFNIIDNDFSGTLQSDLFTGSDILEVLAFAQNGFEGPLPALNRQSAIQVVFGYDNKFEGPIPSSYFQQGELQLLLLANNRLSGSIPEQVSLEQIHGRFVCWFWLQVRWYSDLIMIRSLVDSCVVEPSNISRAAKRIHWHYPRVHIGDTVSTGT